MPTEPAGLARLETRLGHRFTDRHLLTRALTHSSHAYESGRGRDNEPLEFLGDALLGFLIAEALLARFSDMDEGGLSKCKAFLVNRSSLAEVARGLDLGAHLRTGKAAAKAGGAVGDSLLADTLEAVLAAVHLDGGDRAARTLVNRLFGERLARVDRAEVEQRDYKTVLQEAMQARGRPTPVYRVGATDGPPHKPTFHVDLLVEGKVLARGRGGSKKEAEQKAARMALRLIKRAAGRSGS